MGIDYVSVCFDGACFSGGLKGNPSIVGGASVGENLIQVVIVVVVCFNSYVHGRHQSCVPHSTTGGVARLLGMVINTFVRVYNHSKQIYSTM